MVKTDKGLLVDSPQIPIVGKTAFWQGIGGLAGKNSVQQNIVDAAVFPFMKIFAGKRNGVKTISTVDISDAHIGKPVSTGKKTHRVETAVGINTVNTDVADGAPRDFGRIAVVTIQGD